MTMNHYRNYVNAEANDCGGDDIVNILIAMMMMMVITRKGMILVVTIRISMKIRKKTLKGMIKMIKRW